jgi:hypothetical protein
VRAVLHSLSRWAGTLRRRGSRSLWLSVALLVLVASGMFVVGRSTAPASFDQQLPPHVGVPAHARLVRREDYLQARVQNWYYAIPGASQQALTTFYQDQLSRDGWSCFRSSTSINMTRDGKVYSGTSVYMTAWRGTTKAQIYTADQEYGAFLLQDDLPDNAIALKVSLEIEERAQCV